MKISVHLRASGGAEKQDFKPTGCLPRLHHFNISFREKELRVHLDGLFTKVTEIMLVFSLYYP